MEFFERKTFWDYTDKEAFPKGMTPRQLAEFAVTRVSSEADCTQIQLELRWIEAKRPYYSIYSSIARMLLNTKLDIDCKYIQLPLNTLLVRFPTSAPLRVGNIDRPLQSILVGSFNFKNISGIGPSSGLGIWCDRGEMHPTLGLPVFDFQTVMLRDGMTVEESLTSHIDFKDSDDPKALEDCLRVVVGLCLLAKDSELVMPDVLARDRGKVISDTEINRAHRRGKVGWVVGQGVEVCPHIRRPHFGIRWTGPGGAVPQLRPIKGSIVHRKEVTTMPTGHMID